LSGNPPTALNDDFAEISPSLSRKQEDVVVDQAGHMVWIASNAVDRSSRE
jgi:hypothetical protein